MGEAEDLDRTVSRLLGSDTFDAAELPDVLAARGHDRALVVAAVERAQGKLRVAEESPARVEARKARKLGARLLQAGVMWLLVGLGFSIVYGFGLIGTLVVLVGGTVLIAAGARSMKRADLPRAPD